MMAKQSDFFKSYPETPGYKKTDTSKAAARAISTDAKTLRNLAYKCILESPSTSDEVAAKLNQSILSIRPRISELKAKGLILDSSTRRNNSSGKKAIVWRAK